MDLRQHREVGDEAVSGVNQKQPSIQTVAHVADHNYLLAMDFFIWRVPLLIKDESGQLFYNWEEFREIKECANEAFC